MVILQPWIHFIALTSGRKVLLQAFFAYKLRKKDFFFDNLPNKL